VSEARDRARYEEYERLVVIEIQNVCHSTADELPRLQKPARQLYQERYGIGPK
jgi:hypothetical protein